MLYLSIEIILCLLLTILSYFYLEKRYPYISSGMIIYIIIMFFSLGTYVTLKCILYSEQSIIGILKIVTLVSMLFLLTWTDIKERLIPNEILVFYGILRIFFLIFEFFISKSHFFSIIRSMIILFCISAIIFFIISLITKDGIGMGDIKMILTICLYINYINLINIIFYSLIIACIISIYLITTKKKSKKDTMPLAPSFLIGVFAYFFLNLNLH